MLILAPGCAIIGGSAKTEAVDGGVNSAFHNAFYRAQVAKFKGNEEGAKEALLSCLDSEPESAVVHFELSRLERAAGQWSAALAAAEQAVSFDGDNPWYWKEVAEICIELGEMDRADAALR